MKTLELLREIGFASPENAEAGDLVYPVEGGGLAARLCPGPSGDDEVHLTGSIITAEDMVFVEEWLPRFVNSRDHGLALMAHHLSGRGIDPEPDFVAEGRQYFDLLPWRRQAESEGVA